MLHTIVISSLKNSLPFKIRWIPLKTWGCTATIPFPPSAKMKMIHPNARGYSHHNHRIGHIPHSISKKYLVVFPLTCIGRITLIPPLAISLRVILKCLERCEGVFLCNFLIAEGFVGVHVHLVQETIAFSVVWQTQNRCNGPKTFKNG